MTDFARSLELIRSVLRNGGTFEFHADDPDGNGRHTACSTDRAFLSDHWELDLAARAICTMITAIARRERLKSRSLEESGESSGIESPLDEYVEVVNSTEAQLIVVFICGRRFIFSADPSEDESGPVGVRGEIEINKRLKLLERIVRTEHRDRKSKMLPFDTDGYDA